MRQGRIDASCFEEITPAGNHAFRPGFSDLVHPRPTILRPWSYQVESVLDLLVPGPWERDADRSPDFWKCALQGLHNRLKSLRRLLCQMSARWTRLDAPWC